jgi:putative endonuclease
VGGIHRALRRRYPLHVAIDVEARIAQHNGERAGGARYTRARRPVKLVYREHAANRSAACRREYCIKRMTRREKLALIAAASRIIRAARNEE